EVHKLPKVGKLHHIHVWYLNDDELHLEAHLDFRENIDLESFNIILECIEEVLHEKFGINHITIQPEYNKIDPKDTIVQDWVIKKNMDIQIKTFEQLTKEEL